MQIGEAIISGVIGGICGWLGVAIYLWVKRRNQKITKSQMIPSTSVIAFNRPNDDVEIMSHIILTLDDSVEAVYSGVNDQNILIRAKEKI